MSENVAEKRAAVISAMVSSIRSGENRKYYVGLVGYYIEGIPYPASGLSVDLTTTPDICETDGGFACTATFPPEVIRLDTVRANGIERMTVDGQIREVVRVRLEVMIHDIWTVAEFIDGQQRDLLLDPETLTLRLGRFAGKPH